MLPAGSTKHRDSNLSPGDLSNAVTISMPITTQKKQGSYTTTPDEKGAGQGDEQGRYKHGREGYLENGPKELLLSRTEDYVGYSRTGRILKEMCQGEVKIRRGW